jgi:Domain of Unknown Function (DUF748)
MGAITYAGKRAKRFKWLKRIVIALVLYALVGFFVVPAVIKSQMLKRLPALTHREAAVQQVRFNPFALSLTIRGFSLKETNGEDFTSFDEFYVNFQPVASLFKQTWVFSEISLQKPFAQVTYREDGTFNFANLIDTNAPASPSSNTPLTLPRVTIYSLVVSNGAVAFADLKRKDPFHTEFIPIDLNLTNLTTVRDRNSPYSFIARTDSGESFGWSGTITVNPLGSAGVFRLGALRLPKYSTYAHDYARYVIESGKLDVAGAYHYDSSTNALDLTLSNAVVGLSSLVLKSPGNGETNIAIPSFTISDIEASLARRTARVGLIKSSGGFLLVRHETGGIINLLGLLNLPPAESPATNSPPPPETPAWTARIDEIAFDNYTLLAQDKDLDHPATVNLDQIGFDIKGVSTTSNAPVTASLSLRYAGTGTVAVNGTATLMPPSADLQITDSNIDLRTIQPYVEQKAGLAITGGALTLSGRARYASPEPGAPLFSFTGDMGISNFATVDDVLFKDFVKWDAFNVDGIKMQLQPDSLQIDQVEFIKLVTSIILGSNRQPTFVAVLQRTAGATNPAASATTPATPPVAPPAAPQEMMPVAVGAVRLQDASLHAADDFIEPHFSMDIQQMSGTVSNLSSSDQTVATVDIRGQVDERSPFTISGKMNPLATNHYMDMAVTFTNTELTPLSPYSEKYVGRPLSKGKLSFDVHTLIDHNLLKVENGFFIDQFTLGAWNDSPDATHLPVKLAVALLKDRNGRIQLDIPVSGRLDDPKFRVGPVIWQVVENLLVKAATSPFSLLGAAFGGGDELSFVAFDPGQYALSDSETNKLNILAKALFERPALTLEINGSVDTNLDRLPLAHLRLEEQLKSLWAREQQDAGKPALSLDQIQLDPVVRERLVRKMYKARFGPYQPSLVDTNQPGGANSETARIAALLAALPPEARVEHGSVLLRGETAAAKKEKAEIAAAKSSASAAASAAPAVPLTRAQLELEDMEDQLAQKIEITSDDYRNLMQKRANQVQAYLLKTGKVTGERLFVTAPKPINESFQGQDRANLSLD